MTLGLRRVLPNAESAIPLFLVGLFFASGFYDLPFAHLNVNWILKVKSLLYGMFAGLMLLGIDWRQVRCDVFAVGCLLWAGACIASYFILHDVNGELYLKRLVQVWFVWVFVTYVRQHRETLMIAIMKNIFSPWFVAAGGVALIFLAFNREVAAQLSVGFGNNRVNFSIWLSQLVFILFLTGSLNSPDHKIQLAYFLYALPILAIQMFLGSRTGLFASISMYLFALMFLQKNRTEAVLSLLSVLLAAWYFSPLRIDPSMDVTRAISLDVKDTHAWIDRFSSYRVSIAESAVSSLTPVDLLLGKGMGNFQGYAIV